MASRVSNTKLDNAYYETERSMAYRQKMSRGNSRRTFTKHAVRKNKKNFGGRPMRGGIRL